MRLLATALSALLLLAVAIPTAAEPAAEKADPAAPETAEVDAAAAAALARRDALFPRPDALKPRIALWTRVYSEVPTHEGLLHDNEQLEIVYGRVEVPLGMGRRAYQRRLDEVKKPVRDALKALAKGKRDALSDVEKRVLSQWPEGTSNKTFKGAAKRVRFQRGQADRFRDGIVRSGRWEELIRKVLVDEGLPVELAALPHVESSFRANAYSKAGAAGLWQFTRSTGKIFMRVDRVVDERYDVVAATHAAANLLRRNHERTGTWPTAITAYNHGTAGMENAIAKVGTTDIAAIIARYDGRTFGFASRNFYAEFLAAMDVSDNRERYFGELRLQPPADDQIFETDAYYRADALAQALGVERGLLQELNLALREPIWKHQKYVPKGYPLRVPRVSDRAPAGELVAAIAPEQRFKEQRRDRYYRVKRGDSLSLIARRHHMTTRELMDLNGIKNPHRIRAGQRLHLIDSQPAPARTGKAVAVAPAWVGESYTVRRGETLSDIAARVGIPTSELAAANGISRPDRIRAGNVLKVPASASTGGAWSSDRYTVRPGETLSVIARRLGVSMKALAAANGISRPDRIRVGQVLTVPPRS